MSIHDKEEDDRELSLVTLGDDKYAMPVAVTLSSALRNLGPGWEPHVYVLSDGIGDGNKQRIGRVLEAAHPGVVLTWCTPDTSLIDDVPISTWHSRATLLRLFAPFAVPESAKRVILLDSDVVVMGDLGELALQPFEGHAILAVENFCGSTMANCLPRLYVDLNLPPDLGYFNAGMFVLDLPRWRAERITERAIDFLASHRVDFLEQDALNAVVAGNWTLLDPRWNVQLEWLHTFGQDRYPPEERRRLRAEMLARPKLLHYVGPRKPWHWLNKGPKNEEFYRAFRNSGWLTPTASLVFVTSRRISHFLFRQLARMKRVVKRIGEGWRAGTRA
jgi:lipopolysaccharide biosynthesis glycosyltransferase